MVLLLNTLPHLGYVHDRLDEIPPEVREFVASQIDLLWDCSESYPGHSSTFYGHLEQVRENAGWRFANTADKEALESWLRQHGAYEVHTDELLLGAACFRQREPKRVVGAPHATAFTRTSIAGVRTERHRTPEPGLRSWCH